MKISTILGRKGGGIISARAEDTIGDVAKRLAEHRIGALVVLGGGSEDKLIGIVSERDIVRGIAANGAAAIDATVDSVMTRAVITAGPTDDTETLTAIMSERRIRHMPIVDADGLLVGMISIGDVVQARIEEMAHETEALKQFIAS
jgi:CBS domain-containing protein